MTNKNAPHDFISSFSFDQRLGVYDILGSIAHTRMLVKCRIITAKEGAKIITGLKGILRDMNAGKKLPQQEDIHYAVEKELIRRIGKIGGKMHTARSRNDQVALDMRMYTRDETRQMIALLVSLQKAIAVQAQKNIQVIMPGYTHLQPAQPVLFSHHILSYAWMLQRDIERLQDSLKRVNIMPLGSAALAGTSFAIDRKYVAQILGFNRISDNSIDAVSDRDFIVEFLSSLALVAVHLSRLAEELVLWSSAEFGYIQLSDRFTSGSSIMPQKRNPDVAEIIRGKTGRVYGDLFAILTMLKGLPLAYNRDMQEDKPPLFDAVETVKQSLFVMREMITEMVPYPDTMLTATSRGFLCATEIADYLTKKGYPFRDAHTIVKNLVSYCMQKRKQLNDLSVHELKMFSEHFGKDLVSLLQVKNVIAAKKSQGGTSRGSVQAQITKLKRLMHGYTV